jgi:hypothetical protein
VHAHIPISPIYTTVTERDEIRGPTREAPNAELSTWTTGTPLAGMGCRRLIGRLLGALAFLLAFAAIETEADEMVADPVYEVRPIGWIRKADGTETMLRE